MTRLFPPCLFFVAFSMIAFAQETPAGEENSAAAETAAAVEKPDAKAGFKPADTGRRTNRTRLELEKEDLMRPVNEGIQGKPYKKMLPSGFREVLEAEQREEVYKIQEDYHHIIQRLKTRIEELEEERDRAFQAILNPEQKERVAKFRATPRSLRPEPAPRRGR